MLPLDGTHITGVKKPNAVDPGEFAGMLHRAERSVKIAVNETAVVILTDLLVRRCNMFCVTLQQRCLAAAARTKYFAYSVLRHDGDQ